MQAHRENVFSENTHKEEEYDGSGLFYMSLDKGIECTNEQIKWNGITVCEVLGPEWKYSLPSLIAIVIIPP